MDADRIRRTFLDFFAARGHTVVPSASLVPDDPTLLLTNAGMVQFKPYFLGQKPRPYPRATTVQKCFRTVDLEEVGRTTRHLTFFEMLGNFSFGDYFKRDAIRWAWELVTTGFGLEPERLFATVFTTDDEAAGIWADDVGVPAGRILRRGREDNFWSMGVAGPCGPCSELLYDRGDAFGRPYDGTGPVDDERYLEIWNLVFMQHTQDDAGRILGDLPKPSVDTGAGLERIAAILQGVPTAFETDTLAPILRAAEEVTGTAYGQSPLADMSLRVLADHPRAMTVLIADGVLASNEGRGYVLRRLIRRAVRHARLLGVDRALLTDLTAVAIDLFGPVYPEVARTADHIARVVAREESRFDATLRRGLTRLEEAIAHAKGRGEAHLPGTVAFELHDTYGFPLDLTTDFATDEGLSVAVEEFEHLMEAQRSRAREARRAGTEAAPAEGVLGDLQAQAGTTDFLGYEVMGAEGTVAGLLRGTGVGVLVPALQEGEEGELVLDRTPFYAEGGGQIGDRGEVRTASGVFAVADTQWVPGPGGVIVHRGRVTAGEVQSGQAASAQVFPAHRMGTERSHTATHMLHWALRATLGEHARQAGSLVEPGRLRFDFSHYEAVPGEVLARMEEEVNTRVLSDDAVHAFETTYDQATSLGAMALFGEKYGAYVRVVEVGDYSKELCGGTHVHRTGQVGVVKVLGEASIGAGIRRVEAYTGAAGLRYLNEQAATLRRAADLLKAEPDQVVERLEKVLETSKALEGELARQKAALLEGEVRAVLASDAVRPVGRGKLVVLRRDGRPVDDVRRLAIAVRDRLASSVVAVGAPDEAGAKATMVVGVARDLVAAGLSAQALAKPGFGALGGGGGGKPDLVTAGGSKVAGLDDALAAVRQAAERSLEELG
ncbi:MAG TPA: alanine--tRNA ligase [Actinomycetota bacterium]|nr:alanine--tRNA ligase [Actinomycetota bacterium]